MAKPDDLKTSQELIDFMKLSITDKTRYIDRSMRDKIKDVLLFNIGKMDIDVDKIEEMKSMVTKLNDLIDHLELFVDENQLLYKLFNASQQKDIVVPKLSDTPIKKR